jgi:hypothetical protein
MTARTAYTLAALLLASVFATAFVSRHESRNDFIIRQQVGEFDIDAPDLRPPDIEGPDIDGPEIDGPNLTAPNLSWIDLAYTVILVLLVITLITTVILIAKRFGPGGYGDGAISRTTRLGRDDYDTSHTEGEEGWAAFERFCYALFQDPDTGRAVRVAMRYAEAGLGRLESRMADETPNEWLRRTRVHSHDLALELEPIVSSYQSVRFGGVGASPAERDNAVNSLRRLARLACGTSPPASPAPAGTTLGGSA